MNMAGGDNDMDDKAAAPYWDSADGGTWAPEAWRKSPQQLFDEAKAANVSSHAHAAAHANKHSNPPEHTALRPF